MEVLPEGISINREWAMRVNAGIDATEIFGQRLGKVDDTLTFLEGHTLQEIKNIKSDLDGRTKMKIEMRQIVTNLECRLKDRDTRRVGQC